MWPPLPFPGGRLTDFPSVPPLLKDLMNTLSLKCFSSLCFQYAGNAESHLEMTEEGGKTARKSLCLHPPRHHWDFFFGSNLRANSHTTALTPLTGTMRRVSLVFVFRIFTLCCSHHTVELRTLSSPPKETPYPLAVTPTSPILWPQAATKALCVQTHMNGIAQMRPFVTSLPANTRSSPFLCPELPSVLPSLCQTLTSSFLVQFTTFELHAIL